MYQHIDFEIRGIAPLLMHNGQLADPLNEWSRKLSEISGKRKKTEADHRAMSRVEWFGGLYIDDKGHPCIPGMNIEAMLTDAGKKKRLGDAVKAGLMSDGNWPMIYDGPKDPEKLFESGKFLDRRGTKLNGKITVIRTRPIFRNWSLKFSISFLPTLLDPKTVRDLVAMAGQIIGLGDYLPRFGRFELAN